MATRIFSFWFLFYQRASSPNNKVYHSTIPPEAELIILILYCKIFENYARVICV